MKKDLKTHWIIAHCFALGISMVLGASTVVAQTYPSGPVRFVVPYVPGGATDVAARQVTRNLKSSVNMTAVIDNKPGAGAQIGTLFVANALPDGHTVGVVDNSFVINPALVGDKLPYDTLRDFKPVIQLAKMAFIFEVNKDVKASTLQEFIALLKNKGGNLNYGSAGNGSPTHLAMEQFKHAVGVELKHIPYKGGGQSLLGTIGGETQATMATIASSIGHIKSGQLRPLAVTGDKRMPELPDVPTFAELGYPNVDFSYSVGIVAPKNTPDHFVASLNAALNKELADEVTRSQLQTSGFQTVGGTPAAFQTFIAREIPRWQRFVKEAKVITD